MRDILIINVVYTQYISLYTIIFWTNILPFVNALFFAFMLGVFGNLLFPNIKN